MGREGTALGLLCADILRGVSGGIHSSLVGSSWTLANSRPLGLDCLRREYSGDAWIAEEMVVVYVPSLYRPRRYRVGDCILFLWRLIAHEAEAESVRYWVARKDRIPKGLTLQASYGGKDDALIAEHGLKYAKVVNGRDEARALGLKVDTNDALAMAGRESFALLENFEMRKR